jgi:arginyl-tRNA synthetase
MNIFAHYLSALHDVLGSLQKSGKLTGGLDFSKITMEPPREASHGDASTNAAMVLAKTAGMAPRALAELLVAELAKLEDVMSVQIAGPGFINLKFADGLWAKVLHAAQDQAQAYGSSKSGQGIKVNVEYVSANPTGPLHVGHCRGAVFGDALASLLEFTTHDVTREYYINDAGSQVDTLARSAFLRYREALGEDIGEIPAGLYPGDYLQPVGVALAAQHGESLKSKSEAEWLPLVRSFAIEKMMDLIRSDLAALNIQQEVFFSEKSLHDSGQLAKVAKDLEARDLIYTGRLPPPKGEVSEDWEDREQTLFRTSKYGDDTDRALKKSDGAFTYFASDVAYSNDKISRGFHELVYVLGADHSGYVKRLEAVGSALAGNKKIAVVCRLCQLVKLFRNGEPVRMSKRAGEFVTLRDVVDEVGPDVVRFMMLYRKNEAPLDFDFVKVKEQSKDNPVFYVQYAHARICSVFRNAEEQGVQLAPASLNDFMRLSDPAEVAMARKVAEFPRLVAAAAAAHEPHRIAFYLFELASEFHSLWNKGKESPHLRFIIPDEEETTRARLAFLGVIRYCLANGLGILGVRPISQM